MTFWQAFFRVLGWRPRQALAGLYWHLTRRKVRARNRLNRSLSEAPFAYDYWIETVEDHPALAARAPTVIDSWSSRPKFSILLQATPGATSDQIERTIASVEKQIYPDCEILIPDVHGRGLESAGSGDARMILLPATDQDGRDVPVGIEAADGDFLVPLEVGNLLSPGALFRFAEALQAKAPPSILYGDQDEIDRRGKRSRPWLKPQWDEEMFLAQDYLSAACALELDLARRVLPVAHSSGDAAIFALLLAASKAAPGSIIHLPYVLSHVGLEARRSNQAARVAAVAGHVQPLGATCVPGPFDTVKVEWPLPDELPLVSILIPTRDKVDLLRACVDSLLGATRYPNVELIIVDNGSTDPAALSYLAQIAKHPAVRVIPYDHPYNYSAINNFAAGYAAGPYLCLLNNDTEVVTPDWLTEMMRYAVRPDVGAVGAKLLYDDGSIQHAGVVVGIGEAAGHAHRFVRSDEPGYFGQPHLAHVVSAVTAACLVVEKRKFEAVGGLDAEGLAVAFNDVDLCLKLEAAGWRNVYVPHAVLLHHESKSRGHDSAPENIARYRRELAVLQQRWATKSYEDPRHHANLDRSSETFILRL